MVKVIDRRKTSMGGQDKRAVSRIKNIAVHYSATADGNSATFERFWKGTRKWITGGYHEVILRNGDVELNYNPNVISNGVLNHNSSTYNICYVGDGQPTKAQRKTLIERIKFNRVRFNVARTNVKGHREFSGASTSCPAVDVRSLVNASHASVSKPSAPKQTANITGKTADIQRWLNGYNHIDIPVDDKDGPLTQRALIKAYQRELNVQFSAGLTVDGLAGPQTDSAGVTILQGATGNLTRIMQALLYFKGYPIDVDGVFGGGTYEVVRSYQADRGLAVDGKPGKATFSKLIR